MQMTSDGQFGQASDRSHPEGAPLAAEASRAFVATLHDPDRSGSHG